MTATMLGPGLPLEAKSKKGDKFWSEGKVHEAKKEWDAALDDFQKALAEDPSEILYEMACDRARFQAAQMHVDLGLKIRSQGRLGEALLEFSKAYSINPGSIVAGQELNNTTQMIMRERQRVQETGKEAPPEIRALTPYEEARRKENERISRILPIPELKPLDPQPIDWHLSGQKAKKLFEAIGKIAGINVLFDPEYTEPTNNLTIDLVKSTPEEVLDYADAISKSYFKVLSPNTIFVINDTQNKRRDYEELVTKVYYLQNATQPSELQEMQQILRTGCDINRVFPYNSGFALIVRGEADRVELCTKLIHDVDKPKSEVLVDIMVMEASTSLNKQLSAAIISNGLNIPGVFSPRSSLQVQSTANSTTTGTGTSTTTGTGVTSTTGTSTGITSTGATGSTSSTTGTLVPFNQLGHISSADFATTLPSALLQAVMNDTKSRVLQAPQIRAVDNVKAIMNVGEKVPVASGSFQPGVGGIGINPLVNTQFNFQDVGVNVELLARVVEVNEVYMHIKIDVSNIDGYQNQGGISQPIIGQRKIEQELRVREGDVALIGGVIKQQDDTTITGVPGLARIPLLGQLFKGTTINHSHDDLMIVMIPHIIRRPEYTEENLRMLAVGNQTISIHHAPPKAVEFHVDGQIPGATVNYVPVAPGTPGTAPSGTPATLAGPPAGTPATAPPPTVPTAASPATAPTGVIGPPATAPATAPPATVPPAAAPPATAPAATGSGSDADKPAAQPGAARIRFNPAKMEAKISSTVAVQVVIDGGTDVASAPMVIRFDPKMLRLNDVTAGDFLAADGQAPVLTKNIQNDQGMASIVLNRPPGLPGITGPGGVLVNLSFQTVSRGSTTVAIPVIAVRNSQGQPIAAGVPELAISIQ